VTCLIVNYKSPLLLLTNTMDVRRNNLIFSVL